MTYRSRAIPKHTKARNANTPTIDKMDDGAKIYFRQEVDKGTTCKKISEDLKEKYNVTVSDSAVSNYLRREADQIKIAKQRIEKTREWAQVLIEANKSAGGEVDTNKVLMNLIQGDVLQFVSMNKDAMQEKAGDLTLDRLADISYKMAKVNIQNERLALQKRASEVFCKLEEKGKLAKSASKKLAFLSTNVKDKALKNISEALLARQNEVLAANKTDYKEAKASEKAVTKENK